MKQQTILAISFMVFLQACAYPLPTVSTNIIEADALKGNILSISASHCYGSCERMALEKAQTVCSHGYTIHNTEDVNALFGMDIVQAVKQEIPHLQ